MGGWGGGGGGGVAKEKKQGPFMRPKRRFPKKDWKKTKKQKVFGMTASNGKVLAFLVGVRIGSSKEWGCHKNGVVKGMGSSKEWDCHRNGVVKGMGSSKEWGYHRNGVVKGMGSSKE